MGTEAEILGEDDDNPSSGSNSNKNMHILASFFAGMGCVILVVAGLLFVRKMKKKRTTYRNLAKPLRCLINRRILKAIPMRSNLGLLEFMTLMKKQPVI